MALALYSCDLGIFANRDENFYFIFNAMLRRRSPHELRKWMGYLYYLKAALAKVPDQKIEVFRYILL